MFRSVTVIGLLTFAVARADEPVFLPIVATPPSALEPAGLLDGTAVSRPLQPVKVQDPIPSAIPAPTTTAEADIETTLTLPKTWSRYDLLMWFPKAQPLPPLLTLAPPGGFPALNQPGTNVLIGNGSIDTPMSTGGRFTWGSAGSDRDAGLEMTYFFTGTRAARATADGFTRPFTYGRPVVDSINGTETAILVAAPGTPGAFAATSVNRMTGWEVNAVANLYRSDSARVVLLAGYRYFLNHEGLFLRQVTSIPGGTLVDSTDQFDAHTRFHGGQIGFEASGDWNRLYAEVVGKVGFGRSFQVVKVNGQTSVSGPGLAPGGTVPGGILATSTNSGRTTNAAFAVLPEVQINLGYKISDRQRFFVGYNAIYLSEAVRPGDQIDRAYPTAVIANVVGAPALRPAPVFKSTDFWVQGISMGFVHKY